MLHYYNDSTALSFNKSFSRFLIHFGWGAPLLEELPDEKLGIDPRCFVMGFLKSEHAVNAYL